MLLRVALFAMLAVGLIGGAAVAWVVLAAPANTSAAAVAVAAATNSHVLVSLHSLRAGSLIKSEDLAAQDMNNVDVPAGATIDLPQGRSGLIGAMVRRSLSEGQLILPADVVRPGDHGFLAAVLGPNMRGVTVSVDAVSGTAGLIWPGDRVDLILTQALDDPTLVAGRRIAAETVLSDARVIAVDQQIVQGQAPDGATTPANRTATLEVTEPQAERVLVAERLGKLSLSVLSADRQISPVVEAMESPSAPQKIQPAVAGQSTGVAIPKQTGTAITWAGDVSPALGSGETRTAPVMVHIFQGGADSKEFHF